MLRSAKGKTETTAKSIDSKINGTVNQAGTKLKELNKTADKTKAAIDKNTQSIEKFSKSLNSATSALTALTVGMGFWETFNAFDKQQTAVHELEAAILANGGAVKTLSADYQQWASELQSISTQGDETTLQLLQFAESMGVSGDAAKRAVKNALALSQATGRMGTEVLRATVALEQGNATMLGEMIPSIREVKDETEKAAKAQEILGNMFGVVEANAQTAGGKLKQLSNSWGDFKEQIGEAVADVLLPLVKVLKTISDEFQRLPEWVKVTGSTVVILTAGVAGLVAVIATAKAAFGLYTLTLGTYITKATAASAATVGLKLALVALVAYIAKEAYSHFSGMNRALSDLNDAMSISEIRNQRWYDRFSRNTSKIVKEAEGIQNPYAKLKFLDKEINKANKEIEGYNASLKSARDTLEEVDTRYNRLLASDVIKSANADVDDHKKKLELARSRVLDLSRAYDEVRRSMIEQAKEAQKEQEKQTQEVINFIKQMHEQGNVIGKTADEAKIYHINLMNISDELKTAANNVVTLNNALTKQQEVFGRFTSLNQRLIDSIDDIRLQNLNPLNREFIKLTREAENLGREIDNIQNNILKGNLPDAKELEKLTKLRKQLKELETDRAQSRENLVRLLDYEKANKLIQESIKLTEQYKNPFDKFVEDADKLNQLLDNELITEDTYNKAMEDLRDNLKKATEQAKKMRDEFQRINAVDFFSLEGQLRLDELIEKQQQVRDEFRNQAKDNAALNKGIADARQRIPKPIRDRGVEDAVDDLKKLFPNIFPPNAPVPIQQPKQPVGQAQPRQPKEMNIVPAIDRLGGKHDITNKLLSNIDAGMKELNKTKGIPLVALRFGGL